MQGPGLPSYLTKLSAFSFCLLRCHSWCTFGRLCSSNTEDHGHSWRVPQQSQYSSFSWLGWGMWCAAFHAISLWELLKLLFKIPFNLVIISTLLVLKCKFYQLPIATVYHVACLAYRHNTKLAATFCKGTGQNIMSSQSSFDKIKSFAILLFNLNGIRYLSSRSMDIIWKMMLPFPYGSSMTAFRFDINTKYTALPKYPCSRCFS